MNKKNVLDQKIINDFSNAHFCRDAILSFANSALHYDTNDRYETRFYARKLRPHVLKYCNFDKPLEVGEILNYSALSANRILASMYEVDFLLLPDNAINHYSVNDFNEYYDGNRKAAACCAIPYLERYLFSFLEDEISISKGWTSSRVLEYFTYYAETSKAHEEDKFSKIMTLANNKERAGKDWLIQLASDFLLESSPMTRYAAGSYGNIGANLFKIIIDELGYGEYTRKHSTIFERTLSSVDLNPTPHYYWQYYLNTSLLLSNYYNYITRDKRHFFRYIGAIFLAETDFILSCMSWGKHLKQHIQGFDVEYFKEHNHIDKHHSAMVLNELVRPAIERYGEFAAQNIIRGFEEAKWLSALLEKDFYEQTKWVNNADQYKSIHDEIFDKIKIAADNNEIIMQRFIEPFSELSITHCHDQDELCHINSGTMEFINGFGKSTTLHAGEGTIIKRNRLHGALIESDTCNYSIYTIKDHEQWL